MVNQGYWYYDGRVHMTSREYLPYLILALSMLLIFNVFPLVLLTVYPFECFQKFLNFFPCLKCELALRLFMDTFHGCYKDGEHDYRHFAALYLAVRFFNLLLFSVIRNRNACTSAITLLYYAIALALVARFQPYKCKRSNTVDVVMLLTLTTGSVLTSMKSAVGINYPKWVHAIPFTVLSLIPPSDIFCYLRYPVLDLMLCSVQKKQNIFAGESKSD